MKEIAHDVTGRCRNWIRLEYAMSLSGQKQTWSEVSQAAPLVSNTNGAAPVSVLVTAASNP
jgi:hypothetical protein